VNDDQSRQSDGSRSVPALMVCKCAAKEDGQFQQQACQPRHGECCTASPVITGQNHAAACMKGSILCRDAARISRCRIQEISASACSAKGTLLLWADCVEKLLLDRMVNR